MTDKKISELSSNGTLDGTESTVLVQSGGNVKALLSAIKTFVSNIIISATYATIPTLTTVCFVFVAVDETNGNLPTIYFFDGSDLQWIPSIGV